jgi:ESCRT-I complex subunit MVB12
VRTHDLETDADLWKDGFFGKRITRYICVSKSQGRPEHVVHSILILQDKELPPEGYSLVQQTVDSNQRAFKKKQLAFKLVHFRSNVESLIEIIILNKLKTTLPEGFDHVGYVNMVQVKDFRKQIHSILSFIAGTLMVCIFVQEKCPH